MHSTCSAHARETETETEKKDPSNVTITSQETSTKSVRAPKRAAFSLPPWVPEVSWNNFEEMRRKLRKPLTDAARAVNLRKLCAPGGHVIVSTPFLVRVHELPLFALHDYWRFTPRGLRLLLERAM